MTVIAKLRQNRFANLSLEVTKGDLLLPDCYTKYIYNGKVYDVTAGQYIRPGVWSREELAQAGLLDAVEAGVFTPSQHEQFMERLLDVYGK